MKQKWTGLLICLILGCILAGCQMPPSELESTVGPFVYRVRRPEAQTEGQLIEAQSTSANAEDPIGGLLEAFMREPKNTNLKRAMPEDVEILSWADNGDKAVSVYLNEAFRKLNNYDRMIAEYCLTLSLCSLEDVQTVSVYVGNEPDAVGLTAEDVILYDRDTIPAQQQVKLYFPEKDSGYLDYEYHSLPESSASTARMVMEELLRGPFDSSLKTCIPAGTRLLSAETEDGICVVNLSSEFLEGVPEMVQEQRLCIYSVVNSLTALSDTEQVVILSEGGVIEQFGVISLEDPLGRNDLIEGPVNAAKGEADMSLYFMVDTTGKLTQVPAVVTTETDGRQEESLLSRLLTAPSEAGITNLFTESDMYLSVEVSRGICTIDFPENFFVSRQPEELRLAVEALAHTMTGLDGVHAVRLLMNGSAPVYGDLDLSGIQVPHTGYIMD